MAKVGKIEEMILAGADQDVRKLTKAEVKKGTPLGDLAETFIDAANSLLLAGDLEDCGLVIWRAVHDGVPIHELFRRAKELGAKEAGR